MPAAKAFLDHLVAATRERTYTLGHGDYSPKNTLVYQNRLVLLDYEVIHWGDPAFDLGFSLTHLLSKAHHLAAQRAQFAQAAQHYWQTYQQVSQQLTGGVTAVWQTAIEGYAVRHTLACLLARVAGRSPLEYLTAAARTRQQQVVVALMQQPPASVPTLIDDFINRLALVSSL